MIRFIGGKKRGRSTLAGAIESAKKDSTGETGLFDDEKGHVYTLDGEPATIVPTQTLAKVVDLISSFFLRESVTPPISDKEILDGLKVVGEPFYSGAVNLTQKRLQKLSQKKKE